MKDKLMLRNITDDVKDVVSSDEKMLFIYGPRQVGKTTLSKQLAEKFSSYSYDSWDNIDFRRNWTKNPKFLIHNKVTIFDEIHKAKGWKNTLKGLYDVSGKNKLFIVTGSARLNVFKRGGDSLMGRYYGFLLHPFTLGELISHKIIRPEQVIDLFLNTNHMTMHADKIKHLMEYGGFPEPFIKANKDHHTRWYRGRLEKIIREDLRDMSKLPELSQIEMLAAILPEKVASNFSINSLREDIEVSFPTIKRWLNYLEELYFFYSVKPYSKHIARAIKKEGKIYLWDWSTLDDKGAKLENMVASHLYKAVSTWNDFGMGVFGLNLVRDKDGREVDFLITKNKKPWILIEVKSSETSFSPHILYFNKKLTPEFSIQLINKPDVFIKHKESPNCYVSSLEYFLKFLP